MLKDFFQKKSSVYILAVLFFLVLLTVIFVYVFYFQKDKFIERFGLNDLESNDLAFLSQSVEKKDFNVEKEKTINGIYYYEGSPMDIDVKTMKKLSTNHFADGIKVFFGNLQISAADPETFEVFNDTYAKDRNYVYYKETIVCPVDSGDFEAIDYFYGRNNDYVFYENKIIAKNTGQEIKTIGSAYVKIDNFIYFRGEKTQADADSFKLIGEFSIDKNNVYDPGMKVVEGAFPGAFSELGKGFYQDASNGEIYFLSNFLNKYAKVRGVDFDNFKILDYAVIGDDKRVLYCEPAGGEFGCTPLSAHGADYVQILHSEYSLYFRDPDGVYYKEYDGMKNVRKIFDADINSFSVIGPFFSKDNNNVYRINFPVQVSDAKSFALFSDSLYAKDKDSIYSLYNEFEPQVLETDLNSFRHIEQGFAIDKNFLYANGIPVPGIDASDIKFLDSFLFKSKGSVYFRNSKTGQVNELFYVDADSFELVQAASFSRKGYYKDKNNVYYLADSHENSILSVIPGADPASFECLLWNFCFDKNRRFYRNVDISKYNFDFSDIYIIDHNFALINSKLYFYSKINPWLIEVGSDLEDFLLMSSQERFDSMSLQYERIAEIGEMNKRNQKREQDFNAVSGALTKYWLENKNYPDVLGDAFKGENNVLPSDPKINNDCEGYQGYEYKKIDDGKDYLFSYCLEGLGLLTFNKAKRPVRFLDYDNDGLSDEYEFEIGTDPSIPDTDGDGGS